MLVLTSSFTSSGAARRASAEFTVRSARTGRFDDTLDHSLRRCEALRLELPLQFVLVAYFPVKAHVVAETPYINDLYPAVKEIPASTNKTLEMLFILSRLFYHLILGD